MANDPAVHAPGTNTYSAHTESHSINSESATEPQSTSSGLHRKRRTKKKPGAKAHTERINSVSAN